MVFEHFNGILMFYVYLKLDFKGALFSRESFPSVFVFSFFLGGGGEEGC